MNESKLKELAKEALVRRYQDLVCWLPRYAETGDQYGPTKEDVDVALNDVIEIDPKFDETKFSLTNYTLRFGKYRGKNLSTVCNTDPKYLAWLMQQEFIDQVLRTYIEKNTNEIRDAIFSN